jgi:hypothetical protein
LGALSLAETADTDTTEAQQQTALDRVIHLVAVRKDSGNAPLAASAAHASSLADTILGI